MSCWCLLSQYLNRCYCYYYIAMLFIAIRIECIFLFTLLNIPF